MESLSSLVAVIIIVFGILQIILFFKLWGMTNDVKIMKDMFFEFSSKSKNKIDVNEKVNTEKDPSSKFETGDLVVNIESGKQMRIKDIDPSAGIYGCYTNGGTVFEGNFKDSEIKLF